MGKRRRTWQKIIWREWRNCENQEYAKHLFNLVADEPVGWMTIAPIVLLGALYGAMVRLLIGSIVINWDVWNDLEKWTLPWIILQGFVWEGAVIGGVSGLLVWLFIGRRLSWRTWLEWLEPITFQRDVSDWLLDLGLIWVSSGLLIGLLVGPFIGLSFGLLIGLSFGLLVGLIIGLLVGLRVGQRAWRSDGLGSGRLIGLFTELSGGLSGGLFVESFFRSLSSVPSKVLGFGLSFGLLISLRDKLIFWLEGGLFGLFAGLKSDMLSGLHIGLFFGMAFGPLVGMLIESLFGSLGKVLSLGLSFGLLVGLCGGLRKYAEYRHGSIVSPIIYPSCLYLYYLYRLYRSLWSLWRSRPHPFELEAALQEACAQRPAARRVWTEPLRRLEERKQQPGSPPTLIASLQSWGSWNWIERFTARHTLVTLGGESVASLRAIAENRESPQWRTAVWLLKSIAEDTTLRLKRQAPRLLCPHHLVRCSAHTVRLSERTAFTYYGCRACGQSREFLEVPGEVVVILDAGMVEERKQQDDTLRVNWLIHRSLFDFDCIEIVQATDEEVERFAVQVGNDTDALRRRYKKMRCVVAPRCRLAENTLRILRSLFRKVEYHV
jgi:RNase P subunit RPR2